MKKTISLLLALFLCLSLFAGCGSDEDIGGSLSSAPTDSSSHISSSLPEETPAPEEEEFDAGAIIGGTYTNEFIGISCTLDDNWIFFDEAQLAEMNGLTADAVSDEAIAEQLRNSGVVYDMYAMSADSLYSINVILEDLGLLYGALLSEEDYAELSMESLPEALSSAGFADLACNQTTVSFCGKEHAAITISATIQDIAIYETLVCVKTGDYMVCITFASYLEDDTAQLMELFSAIE